METALIRIGGNTSEMLLQRAEAVQDNYTAQIRLFTQWARDHAVGIDQDGIREYFQYLNESRFTAGTIRNRRAAVKNRVRAIYHDAPIDDRMKIDRVLTDLDHDPDTKAPKLNSTAITADKVLNAEAYRELLEKCRSARQRAFIMFLYSTGCRVAELTGITLDRCEIQGDTVKIRVMGKGSKERFVRIPATLFETIQETFNGSAYLFETSAGTKYRETYISTQIKKIGKRIGRNISAHTLRHSFATRKVQQFPGKIDAVSRYLGHSNISTTMNYYVHTQLSDIELFENDIAM